MTTILYIISFASIKKDFKNLSLISAPVIVAVVMHPMHLGLLINYDLKTDILRVFSKTLNDRVNSLLEIEIKAFENIVLSEYL